MQDETSATATQTSLIDLLGAMGDYFDARRELNEQMAAYDGYSFDYFGRSYIEACERALRRVEDEWAKLRWPADPRLVGSQDFGPVSQSHT